MVGDYILVPTGSLIKEIIEVIGKSLVAAKPHKRGSPLTSLASLKGFEKIHQSGLIFMFEIACKIAFCIPINHTELFLLTNFEPHSEPG